MDVGTAKGWAWLEHGAAQRSFAFSICATCGGWTGVRRKGYRPGESLRYIEEEGGVHHESAWARRLPDALRFLLGSGSDRGY